MQHRVGDIVRLKTKVPSGQAVRTGWSGNGSMDHLLGANVTISTIMDRNDRTPTEGYIEKPSCRFKIVEEPRWVFWARDIEAQIQRADGLSVEPLPEKKPSSYVKEIEDIVKIAQEVYGEERVMIEKQAIIIHFPEIEISNSNKSTHTIRDLYVKVNINNNIDDYEEDEEDEGLRILNISVDAIRTTFTLPEVTKRYTHSHISGSGFCQWSSFCLGKSDFAILITNLGLDPIEEQWQMFFLSLDKYVRWESLEGGPYAKIEEISMSRSIDNALLKKELARIVRGIPLSEFDIISNKLILKSSSVVNAFFNKYSTLRSLSHMTEEMYEKEKATSLLRIHQSCGKVKKIGNKEIPFNIVKHEFESPEGEIDLRIVKAYINIFNSCNINLNTISYEREKRNQKTFGEIGIV